MHEGNPLETGASQDVLEQVRNLLERANSQAFPSFDGLSQDEKNSQYIWLINCIDSLMSEIGALLSNEAIPLKNRNDARAKYREVLNLQQRHEKTKLHPEGERSLFERPREIHRLLTQVLEILQR